MRYSQLRAFDAVARWRSFSRAAEELHISQPAVSLHVRALEKDHALDLFQRRAGGVALTAEGQALFRRTREMFAAEGEIRDYLTGESGLDEETLKLGADGPHVALDLVARLRQQHPALTVDIALGNHRTVWEDLLAQNVDAAVIANPPEREGFLVLSLAHQRMMVLLPAGHRLAQRGTLALSDLSQEALIFREPGSNTQRILEGALARAALTVTPAFVLRSREAVLAAVVVGLGLGFAFSREVGQDPRLQAVPLSDPKVTSEDMLVCQRSKAQRRRLAPLMELARSLPLV